MPTSSTARARNELRAACDRLLELGGVGEQARHEHHALAHGSVHHVEVGSGRPIVLVHGAGGGSANWYRLMAPLAAGYRVLAPDLPGFGESDAMRAESPLGRYGARVMIEWLEATTSPPWILVGTSFGGLVVLRIAQARPTDVRGLVLLDAVGLGREAPLPVRLAAVPAFTRSLLHPTRAGTKLLFDLLLTTDRHRIPRAHRDALVDYLWCSAAAGGADQLAATLRHFLDLRGQREVLDDAELAAIAVRTLVAWGERDRFLPVAHARYAAAAIPGAELRILPRAGHSPNWESADELAAILVEFVGRLG